MKKAQPYLPTDFVAERDLDLKQENRVQEMARISSEQIKTMQRKYERRISEIRMDHKRELEKSNQESYDAGYKQGGLDTKQAVDQALDVLKEVSARLLSSEKSFLKNAEKHVVSLALCVTKKILGREAESDKDIVVSMVKESLARVADKAKIAILVNPADLENILSHRKELQEVDRDLPELEFLPDDKLDPGECIVETRTGSIDGRFASQVAEIERKFSLN